MSTTQLNGTSHTDPGHEDPTDPSQDDPSHMTSTNRGDPSDSPTENGVAVGWLSPMPPTKCRHEVPNLFREPYLLTGFRPLYQHWSYYAKSLFQIHNECLNVWTHLLAFLFTFWKLLYFIQSYDLYRDPYMWPLVSGFLVSFIMFISSAGAHCFQSHSPHTHYNCFLIDYAGIGLYGFGCAQLHYYYCAETDFYESTKRFFIPLSCFLGFFAFFANLYGKIRYKRPYPKIRKVLQMGSVFLVYLTLISPVMHRYYACLRDATHCSESLPVHGKQMICFITSGFFYASSIPQRLWPGKFDFLAHSHQIFHVFISFTTFYKFDALLVDIRQRKEIIYARPEPSFWDAFGPAILIISLEVFFVLKVQEIIKEKTNKGH